MEALHASETAGIRWRQITWNLSRTRICADNKAFRFFFLLFFFYRTNWWMELFCAKHRQLLLSFLPAKIRFKSCLMKLEYSVAPTGGAHGAKKKKKKKKFCDIFRIKITLKG